MKNIPKFLAAAILMIALAGCTTAKAPVTTPMQPTQNPTPTPEVDQPIGPPAAMPVPKVPTKALSVHDFGFDPAQVTVAVGTKVTWTNDDPMPHTVTSDTAGLFASKQLFTGDKFSYTFSTAGNYTYHCGLHPSMKATITVQ